MSKINYRSLRAYKYQLMEDYTYALPHAEWENTDLQTDFYSLADGVLTVRAGYCWDGPSGPTFDTPDFMRGSLVHDVLYQMMREKEQPQTMRPLADDVLRLVCIEDGMSRLRAWYVWKGVRLFGAKNAATK